MLPWKLLLALLFSFWGFPETSASSKYGVILSTDLPSKINGPFHFPLYIETRETSTAATPGHFIERTAWFITPPLLHITSKPPSLALPCAIVFVDINDWKPPGLIMS